MKGPRLREQAPSASQRQPGCEITEPRAHLFDHSCRCLDPFKMGLEGVTCWEDEIKRENLAWQATAKPAHKIKIYDMIASKRSSTLPIIQLFSMVEGKKEGCTELLNKACPGFRELSKNFSQWYRDAQKGGPVLQINDKARQKWLATQGPPFSEALQVHWLYHGSRCCCWQHFGNFKRGHALFGSSVLRCVNL